MIVKESGIGETSSNSWRRNLRFTLRYDICKKHEFTPFDMVRE